MTDDALISMLDKAGLPPDVLSDVKLMMHSWDSVLSSANTSNPPEALRVNSDALVIALKVIMPNIEAAIAVMSPDDPLTTYKWLFLMGMVFGQELTVQRHA